MLKNENEEENEIKIEGLSDFINIKIKLLRLKKLYYLLSLSILVESSAVALKADTLISQKLDSIIFDITKDNNNSSDEEMLNNEHVVSNLKKANYSLVKEQFYLGKILYLDNQPYYNDIYDLESKGLISDQEMQVVAYFPFIKNGDEYISFGSLRTPKDLKKFINQHIYGLDEIIWRVALSHKESDLLTKNNASYSVNRTDCFIDYNPLYYEDIKKYLKK